MKALSAREKRMPEPSEMISVAMTRKHAVNLRRAERLTSLEGIFPRIHTLISRDLGPDGTSPANDVCVIYHRR